MSNQALALLAQSATYFNLQLLPSRTRPNTTRSFSWVGILLALILATPLLSTSNTRDLLRSLVDRDETASATEAATRPIAQPRSTELESLSPEMLGALQYASRRYRVSADALQPIFMAAQQSARTYQLDPMLVVAVIAIESSFNPLSESVVGAQGLMQIIPRFHPEKLPENADKLSLFDPVVNVQVGTRTLNEYIRRYGSTVAGLQQYAGASDDAERSYANKVLAERERIDLAAKRRQS